MDPDLLDLHEPECPRREGKPWCSIWCVLLPAPEHEPPAVDR